MAVIMESAVFVGKNYLNSCQSMANTTDLTFEQMFDTSARLVSEQDEISGLETFGWENHSWKCDERIINFQRTKVYVFSDSVLCFGKIFENHESNDAWEQRLECFKTFQEIINLDRIDGDPVEFEENSFPGFHTLQFSEEVKSLVFRKGETFENYHRKKFFMSMFNDIFCGTKDNEKECLANNGHLLDQVLKRRGIVSVKTVPSECVGQSS